MPDVFSDDFWALEAERLFNIMLPYVEAAVSSGELGALAELGLLGVDIEAIPNLDAIGFANSYTFDLVSGITGRTQQDLQDKFTAWIASGEPLPDLIDQLGPMYSPVRAEMIAVTEVTRIFAEANLAVWGISGMVEGKRWLTAFDDIVCPICKPINTKTAGLNSSFEGGDGREYTHPPAHVRCRCWLQPVLTLAKVFELGLNTPLFDSYYAKAEETKPEPKYAFYSSLFNEVVFVYDEEAAEVVFVEAINNAH